MTRPGFWKHWKGELVRVLFNVRQSTNGPDEGRSLVIYVHCGGDDLPGAWAHAGTMHARDEKQFHERVWKDTGKRVENPSTLIDPEEVERSIDRFTFVGDAP